MVGRLRKIPLPAVPHSSACSDLTEDVRFLVSPGDHVDGYRSNLDFGRDFHRDVVLVSHRLRDLTGYASRRDWLVDSKKRNESLAVATIPHLGWKDHPVLFLRDDPFSAAESAKVAKDAVEQFWKERSR